jgi:hypothetical protein
VARWFRLSLTVSRPFVCGCLTSPAMLRFHIPLIKPDRRSYRIRLSDKVSRFRPREGAGQVHQPDQAELVVQVYIGEA